MGSCQSSNAVDTPFGRIPQHPQQNQYPQQQNQYPQQSNQQSNRKTDLMSHMMSNVAAMQQQQLAKQQQMMQSDPECRQLMERQAGLQSQLLAATTTGDANASMQAQMQMAELMKNPKYLEMMMPDMNGMRGMKTTQTKRTGLFGGVR